MDEKIIGLLLIYYQRAKEMRRNGEITAANEATILAAIDTCYDVIIGITG